MQITTELQKLADAARCVNDDDWGSERQIAAFNHFNNEASKLMTPASMEEWDDYSMKATNDEIIDKALALLKAQ